MNSSFLYILVITTLSVVNIAVWSGLVDKYLISWSWHAVLERYQYWRLLTGVLFSDQKPFSGVFSFLHIRSDLKFLDERCYCSTRKFMMPIIASFVTSLILGTLIPENPPFVYWQLFLSYLKSREYPDDLFRIFGILISGIYIPLIRMRPYMKNSSGKKGAIGVLLSFLSAHTFYFLDDVLSVRFDISPILALEKGLVWLFRTLTFSQRKKEEEKHEDNNGNEPQIIENVNNQGGEDPAVGGENEDNSDENSEESWE